MKKTIFFDFDGVIADSFHIAFEVSQMERPSLTFESYKEKFAKNISQATFDEPKADVEIDFQKEYAKKMRDLKLAPDKKEVLKKLSEKYNFHIISSTDTKTIQEFCEANDIHHHFDDILGYDIETSKVKKFKSLLEKYNLKPEDIIFITDTVGDIEEAKEVGIELIIAVADGYQDREVLKEANPSHLTNSIVEVESILL